MRCFNTSEITILKVTSIYKTQNILQLNDIYSLQMGKFMYKHNKSQLTTTYNDYFTLISDVCPYNARQTKTRQFALPKARSH